MQVQQQDIDVIEVVKSDVVQVRMSEWVSSYGQPARRLDIRPNGDGTARAKMTTYAPQGVAVEAARYLQGYPDDVPPYIGYGEFMQTCEESDRVDKCYEESEAEARQDIRDALADELAHDDDDDRFGGAEIRYIESED